MYLTNAYSRCRTNGYVHEEDGVVRPPEEPSTVLMDRTHESFGLGIGLVLPPVDVGAYRTSLFVCCIV